MFYSLPNGKVINISIGNFLEMTEDDIQSLIAYNAGEYISNPFTCSYIDKDKQNSSTDLIDEEEFFVYEELFEDEVVYFDPEFFEDDFEEKEPPTTFFNEDY